MVEQEIAEGRRSASATQELTETPRSGLRSATQRGIYDS